MIAKQINDAEHGGKKHTEQLSSDDWVRLPKPGQRFYGLSRTTLAEMCERGEIKSCVVKQRGAIRGIRLIFAPSLREHLERLAKESKS